METRKEEIFLQHNSIIQSNADNLNSFISSYADTFNKVKTRWPNNGLLTAENNSSITGVDEDCNK